jgi:hypothetical protein
MWANRECVNCGGQCTGNYQMVNGVPLPRHDGSHKRMVFGHYSGPICKPCFKANAAPKEATTTLTPA